MNSCFQMALPSLPTTYTTRKNIYEAAIVHRRTHENDFRGHWSHASNYFKSGDLVAEQKKRWESNKSFQSSMDAYKKQSTKEAKRQNLEKRRSRLLELIVAEQAGYEAELRDMCSPRSDIGEMKERSETLRSAREEKRQTLANAKLYEHFRVNNPDLREVCARFRCLE